MTGRGPLLVLLGGLFLAYGGAGAWVRATSVRDVGGVEVPSTVVLQGGEFAPLALPAGLVVVLLGVAALVARGRARRALGALSAVAALTGLWLVAAGLPGAMSETGSLSAAPWVALLGGGLAVAGAALTVRAPRAEPLLDERYTVEGAPAEDAEWELAAEEPPESAS